MSLDVFRSIPFKQGSNVHTKQCQCLPQDVQVYDRVFKSGFLHRLGRCVPQVYYKLDVFFELGVLSDPRQNFVRKKFAVETVVVGWLLNKSETDFFGISRLVRILSSPSTIHCR